MSTERVPFVSYFFGGASCMVAASITHPVDTIKVRLQLNGELIASPVKRNVIKTMLTEEGLISFWRGLTPSLLREGSYSTIRMGLYDPIKQKLRINGETAEPLYKKIIAGGISGMIGSAIATPTDLLKVRFQGSVGMGKSPSLIGTFMDIWRTEGLKGIYRGIWPTTQRAVILTATQLPAYDHSKKLLLETTYFEENVFTHFVSSMIAGFFVATTTSPIDVVKSRLMHQPVKNGVGQIYSSTIDCFAKIIKNEGVRGLYKGWLPNWLRIGPHTVITFIILEQMRKAAGMQPV